MRSRTTPHDSVRRGPAFTTVLAVAVIAMTATMTSCSDSSTTTPEPSLTSDRATPEPASSQSAIVAPDDARSAAAKALATYRAMWAAYDSALSIPDPQFPALTESTTGDARTLLIRAVQSAKDKGLKGTGRAIFRPEVVEVSPASQPKKVTIRDCLDTRDTHLVNASPGATPYKDEPGGRRRALAIVERQGDGNWVSTSVAVWDVGSC